MAEVSGSCCCRPSPPLSGLGVGQAGRAQAILGPWPDFLTILGGAGDVAFTSGNPSWTAVLGRLLTRGEVYPYPPCQTSSADASGQRKIVEFQGSAAPEGGHPQRLLSQDSYPHASCQRTGCILSADPASHPLHVGLQPREGRGPGGLHTPLASGRAPLGRFCAAAGF